MATFFMKLTQSLMRIMKSVCFQYLVHQKRHRQQEGRDEGNPPSAA